MEQLPVTKPTTARSLTITDYCDQSISNTNQLSAEGKVLLSLCSARSSIIPKRTFIFTAASLSGRTLPAPRGLHCTNVSDKRMGKHTWSSYTWHLPTAVVRLLTTRFLKSSDLSASWFLKRGAASFIFRRMQWSTGLTLSTVWWLKVAHGVFKTLLHAYDSFSSLTVETILQQNYWRRFRKVQKDSRSLCAFCIAMCMLCSLSRNSWKYINNSSQIVL